MNYVSQGSWLLFGLGLKSWQDHSWDFLKHEFLNFWSEMLSFEQENPTHTQHLER